MLNVSLDKEHLEALLARAQSVSERRHTIMALTHALITADNGTLTIVASDLDIVVRSVASAQVNEKGTLALPARKFFDIVKAFPKGTVTIAGKEGNHVEIAAGRGHYKLSGLAATEFPEMPKKPEGTPVSVDCEVFRKLIDRVISFAASDEGKLAMSGILFEKKETDGKSVLRLVATDGHRMGISEVELAVAGDLLKEGKMIVPRKGLLEIRKMAEGTGSVELLASEKFLFASKGDSELWVTLIAEAFPPYEQVVPKENKVVASIQREPLFESVRRISILAPEKICSIHLSFQGKQLEISTPGTDVGDGRELMEAEYNGQPMKVGFNGKYLLDAITAAGDEAITLEMKDGSSSVIVRSATDTSFLAVVMPIRL